jgi:hypothetical protein
MVSGIMAFIIWPYAIWRGFDAFTSVFIKVFIRGLSFRNTLNIRAITPMAIAQSYPLPNYRYLTNMPTNIACWSIMISF